MLNHCPINLKPKKKIPQIVPAEAVVAEAVETVEAEEAAEAAITEALAALLLLMMAGDYL